MMMIAPYEQEQTAGRPGGAQGGVQQFQQEKDSHGKGCCGGCVAM